MSKGIDAHAAAFAAEEVLRVLEAVEAAARAVAGSTGALPPAATIAATHGSLDVVPIVVDAPEGRAALAFGETGAAIAATGAFARFAFLPPTPCSLLLVLTAPCRGIAACHPSPPPPPPPPPPSLAAAVPEEAGGCCSTVEEEEEEEAGSPLKV